MIAVYILRCADGSLYIGSSRRVEHRLEQHFAGLGGAYTSARMPVRLAHLEPFDRIDEAYAREKTLQNWSHAKREALIAGDLGRLPELARKRRPRETRHY
jgi:putative endonuclease